MTNPILQMLSQKSPLNNMMNIISAAKGNPQGMFNSLMNNNPQFRKFINDNKGKSVEQIAEQYGVDMSLLNNFMK